MEHDQRVCPRCGKPAGDFHFCPSCLAPIDSLSALLTSQARRLERSLAASDADHMAGRDSTATLQVESDHPTAERQPNAAGGAGSELQLRLDGRASASPPASRDVARLEDVLTVAPKAAAGEAAATTGVEPQILVDPRVSVPPPAPREVARLEDVLTVHPDDDSVRIEPKTAAAAKQVQSSPEIVQGTSSVEPPAPAEKPAAKRQPGPRSYVPAYALRAAFWFEQASAFESSSDDDEDEAPVTEVAPVVESVPPPAPVAAELPAGEPLVETPRKHWMLSLCLLGLVGLVIVLTGRRPCRCSCHGKS